MAESIPCNLVRKLSSTIVSASRRCAYTDKSLYSGVLALLKFCHFHSEVSFQGLRRSHKHPFKLKFDVQNLKQIPTVFTSTLK